MPIALRAWHASWVCLLCTGFALPGCLSGTKGTPGDPVDASLSDDASTPGGPVDATFSDDASTDEPDRITVEIGKGEATFETLTPGETLPLVAGGQGGFHVFVGFRVVGIDPQRVLTEVTTRVRGASESLTRRGRLSYQPEGSEGDAGLAAIGGYLRYVGWPAEILDARDHEGEEVVIEVNLEDRFGVRAEGETTVVIGALR